MIILLILTPARIILLNGWENVLFEPRSEGLRTGYGHMFSRLMNCVFASNSRLVKSTEGERDARGVVAGQA